MLSRRSSGIQVAGFPIIVLHVLLVVSEILPGGMDVAGIASADGMSHRVGLDPTCSKGLSSE